MTSTCQDFADAIVVHHCDSDDPDCYTDYPWDDPAAFKALYCAWLLDCIENCSDSCCDVDGSGKVTCDDLMVAWNHLKDCGCADSLDRNARIDLFCAWLNGCGSKWCDGGDGSGGATGACDDCSSGPCPEFCQEILECLSDILEGCITPADVAELASCLDSGSAALACLQDCCQDLGGGVSYFSCTGSIDCDCNNDGVTDCTDLTAFMNSAIECSGGSVDAAGRVDLICAFLYQCGAEQGLCEDLGNCVLDFFDPDAIPTLTDFIELLVCIVGDCDTVGGGESGAPPISGKFPWGTCPPPRTAGSPKSAAPVDLYHGFKFESTTDLVVPLVGIDFFVTREYSSDLGWTSPGEAGDHWSSSLFRRVDFSKSDSDPNYCCAWSSGGYAGGSIMNTGCQCSGSNGTWPGQVDLLGPTAQFFGMSDLDYGTYNYAVWTLHEPGRWEIDFFRDKEGVSEPGDDDPPAGLVGKIAEVRDTYGNRHRYNYTEISTGSGSVWLLTSVECYDAEDTEQALVYLFWNLDAGSLSGNRLGTISVMRQSGTDWVVTQRVLYTYLADDGSPWLGKTGDLVQVRCDERVDPEPGATSSAPVWRTLITQYRYHTGNPETNGDTGSGGDNDGYLEEGDAHQLKMVILPQQVEYFAQASAPGTGGPFTVDELADDLMALGDGEDDPTSGLAPVDLASKIVARYESSGEKRVLEQYQLTGCGCGGGSGQGLRQEFSYYTWGTNSEGHTTKIVESARDDAAPSTWNLLRTRYYDTELKDPGGSSDHSTWAPYLTTEAIKVGTDLWVTSYEYSTDGQQLTRLRTPSAMATAQTAYDPCDSNGDTPGFGLPLSGGLVYAYVYDSNDDYPTDALVREGAGSSDATSLSGYSYLSRTTYDVSSPPASGDHPWLVVKEERVRAEDQASFPTGDADLETVEYEYGFHSGDAIAWIRTSVEAEEPEENGPGGTYDSWELFDGKGDNDWSIDADGSYTKRVFDIDDSGSVCRTGAVVSIVRNADTTNDGFPTSPRELPTGLPGDRNADGGSLRTTFTRDLLGRIQESTSPGLVASYTTHEMRELADRPNLLYYAEVSLPPHYTASSVDHYAGPAAVTWRDASGTAVASRDYSIGSSGYTTASGGSAYAQVFSDYDLDTTLSRWSISQHASGLVEARNAWSDASASSPDVTTTYTYDSLGRIWMTESPNGSHARRRYDPLDRLVAVDAATVNNPDVDENPASPSDWANVAEHFYDSGGSATSGVGNGNVTYVRQHPNGSDTRITISTYDFRDRLVRIENPEKPNEYRIYDNLDRVVERAVFTNVPSGPSDMTGSNSSRGMYMATAYSQRGLPYRQRIAIDPTVALVSMTYLEDHSWFDPVGRTVEHWGPNAPATKSAFDGLGRVQATYSTDRRDDDVPDETTPPTDVYADALDVDGDVVFEQVNYRYIDGSTPAVHSGQLDLITTRRRTHDADDTDVDALDDGGFDADKVVTTFAARFYDGADRLQFNAEYGTGETYFESGGSAPTISQSSPPSPSATVLVTETTYNDRGLVESTVDPDSKATRRLYDDLNRTYAVIEDYVDAVVEWDGTLGRWKVSSGLSTSNPDVDRVTSYVYDLSGHVVKQTAHLPGGGGGAEGDAQVTTYTYGVDTDTSGNPLASGLYSDDLLSSTTYPDSESAFYSYNRLGEVIAMEDQNDTRHTYSRDGLGRITQDEAVIDAEGGATNSIDDTYDTIVVDYDDLGRLERVDTLAQSGNAVSNAVGFTYTPLWQVQKVLQDHDGVLDLTGTDPSTSGNTRKVEYSYGTAAVGATGGGNYSRLTSMAYPANSNASPSSPAPDPLRYEYGTSGTSDHRISRVTGLTLNSTRIAEYGRIGLDVLAVLDLPVPDVQLDRTFSHDGKRQYNGYSDNAGVYPGLDRFGRVIRHAWLDGRLTTHATLTTVPNVPPIVELAYSYDPVGNRETAYDDRPGAGLPFNHQYTYDGLDRLTEARRGTWDGSAFTHGVDSRKWDLDMLGNWDALYTNLNGDDDSGDPDYSDSGETETRTHNDVNELTARNTDGTGGDEVALTYDKAGNLRTSTESSRTTTYTHDCWNRLVKVEMTISSVTSTRARCLYNGLNWRTVKRTDSDLSAQSGDAALDEERVMTYSANWQLLEERIDRDYQSSPGLNARTQYVWGQRYIDDCILHRRDEKQSSTLPDGDYADSGEGTWYHLTDAMFSTVRLVDAAANLVESDTYDAYGQARHHWKGDVDGDGDVDPTDTSLVNAVATGSHFRIGQSGYTDSYRAELDLNRDGAVTSSDRSLVGSAKSALASGRISDTGSGGPANVVGWDGYIYNLEDSLYTVRYRHYESVLGRWIERDPAGDADGSNVYLAFRSAPPDFSDPTGLLSNCTVVVFLGDFDEFPHRPKPVGPTPNHTRCAWGILSCHANEHNYRWCEKDKKLIPKPHLIKDFPDTIDAPIGIGDEECKSGYMPRHRIPEPLDPGMPLNNDRDRYNGGRGVDPIGSKANFEALVDQAIEAAQRQARAFAADCNCECDEIEVRLQCRGDLSKERRALEGTKYAGRCNQRIGRAEPCVANGAHSEACCERREREREERRKK